MTNDKLKAKAISALRPRAEYAMRDGVVEWLDTNQTEPSDAEIQAKMTELVQGKPMADLRAKRDRLIGLTDWTQAEDIPQATRDLWKPYRQALRDITKSYSSLDGVVWPDKPVKS